MMVIVRVRAWLTSGAGDHSEKGVAVRHNVVAGGTKPSAAGALSGTEPEHGWNRRRTGVS